MIEKIDVHLRRKSDNIVLRVDSDTKDYVKERAASLQTNISSYVKQLIENDRSVDLLVIDVSTFIWPDNVRTVAECEHYLETLLQKNGVLKKD